MASESNSLTGNCIPPFLDVSKFPATGGSIAGRFCSPLDPSPDSPICCLPCPTTDWIYPRSFNTYMTVAQWLAVAGLVLLTFMLISYTVLPTQKTRSHYLSVCLIISTMMVGLGFTIPLASDPEQCYNEITPNDMYSLPECAWSGSFIIAGGFSAVVWILIRALSMNLQICWDIVPGEKFFYAAQALGWGIPGAIFAVIMTMTGVSFRFGNICHVNHENSLADFWGPIIGFAGAAGLVQLFTFAYCIRVYLSNLLADSGRANNSTNHSGTNMSSLHSSLRTQTTRAVWRRLQKVLWLQWRGICIVIIILVDVIFFAVVFVRLDSEQAGLANNADKVKPWVECLAFNPTDREACLPFVKGLLVNEPTVAAVLIMLSLTGIQVFIFLTRPSIFPAWYQFFRTKLGGRSREFVSLDAKPDIMRSQSSKQELVSYTRGHESTTFEMQSPSPGSGSRFEGENKTMSATASELRSPEAIYRSPTLHGGEKSPAGLNDHRNSLIGRGRIPSDYQRLMSPVSPDLGISGRRVSFTTGPTSPPPSQTRFLDSGRPTSILRQPSSERHTPPALVRQNSADYFSPTQTSQQHHNQFAAARPSTADSYRPGSSTSSFADRPYQPPINSFSGPTTPSRHSSFRAAAAAAAAAGGTGASFDPRDTYSRGGLALNPPDEESEGIAPDELPRPSTAGGYGYYQSRRY